MKKSVRFLNLIYCILNVCFNSSIGMNLTNIKEITVISKMKN